MALVCDEEALYESEEGQEEFAEWKTEQERKQQHEKQEELPAAE